MYNPGKTLNSRESSIMELGIKDIDRMFKTLVAEKRNMSLDDVNRISGGIPWSGQRAVNIGLADEVGGLDDACRSAASLAGIDVYAKTFIEPNEDLKTRLLYSLLWGRSAKTRGQ
jgi:protease-4